MRISKKFVGLNSIGKVIQLNRVIDHLEVFKINVKCQSKSFAVTTLREPMHR